MVSPADQAARERKQKIFVVVGGLLLLALLAIQLPRFLGGSSETTATPTTTETAIGEPEAQPTPQTRTPTSLVNTDRALEPAPGQLSSFSEFSGKDPFVQQVSFDSTAPTEDVSGGKQSQKSAGKPQSKEFTVGGSPNAAATVVSVNGDRQALVPGTAFPSTDPVFVLVAERPKMKSVTIGIAGGEYASGSRTTKLVVGRPLVLVNTTTGARYKLVLVAVGNGAASSAPEDRSSSAKTKKPSASTP